MDKKNRWMSGLLKEAQTMTVQMPWERGLRRDAMIARRNAPSATRRHLAGL